VNQVIEDQTMWLKKFQAQLVSNLEKTQERYKDNVNEHWKEQPNFKVRDQILL
jgi:hypothetical protein